MASNVYRFAMTMGSTQNFTGVYGSNSFPLQLAVDTNGKVTLAYTGPTTTVPFGAMLEIEPQYAFTGAQYNLPIIYNPVAITFGVYYSVDSVQETGVYYNAPLSPTPVHRYGINGYNTGGVTLSAGNYLGFVPLVIATIPVAPSLTVKVPNESSGIPITPQILANGLPVQGYMLTVVTQPTQGTVTISADGTHFIYTPTLGTTMVPDSFTYTATYGGNTSPIATVNLFIFTQYNCACDMNDDPGEGFPTYTLDQMQRRVLVRLGMAAMPTPPPGMAETINTFLEDSQNELYRMYKCFRLKRWFTWQLQQGIRFYDWNASIANTSMLIQAPNAPAAVPTTGTGTLAANTYQYAYTYVNDNGESTPSPLTTVTLSATGEITLTFANTPGIKGINVYRMAATGPYGETMLSFMAYVNNALSFIDDGSINPIAQCPPSANNTDICSKTLDPREIKGVYISRGDNVWQPLWEGIPPTMYTSKIQAIPQRYEVKQCIEIWPAPSDNTWQMRIVGDFALRRFTQPLDVTTIDPHAIYLKAVADVGVHYGKQAVAQAAVQSLELYLKKLIAGTDANTRLWPGTGVVINAIPPKMAGT
jgi:hypothetical protein